MLEQKRKNENMFFKRFQNCVVVTAVHSRWLRFFGSIFFLWGNSSALMCITVVVYHDTFILFDRAQPRARGTLTLLRRR